jgi:hypothetical protein
MEFRRRDILVIAAIWIGVFALALVVGVFIADDDPNTSDGAALSPFVLLVGGVLTGLYILVRERGENRRKRLAQPPREKAVVFQSSARFRDNWKQLFLAAGLWVLGTLAFVPLIGIDYAAAVGSLLPLGVLLVLHRRDARQRK